MTLGTSETKKTQLKSDISRNCFMFEKKNLKEQLIYCKIPLFFSISLLLISTFAILCNFYFLVFLMYLLNAPVILILNLFHLKNSSIVFIFAFYVLGFVYWLLIGLVFKISREQYRPAVILTLVLLEVLSALFLSPLD